MRTRNLNSLTQLPNCQMDIACDTEMVHSIPYISPLAAFDLTSGYGHHGAWGLFVYSPLLAGAAGS